MLVLQFIPSRESVTENKHVRYIPPRIFLLSQMAYYFGLWYVLWLFVLLNKHVPKNMFQGNMLSYKNTSPYCIKTIQKRLIMRLQPATSGRGVHHRPILPDA